jgi:hypothetical protein
MIRYALECDQDHRFESWFASSEAFDRLAASAALSCPDCGSQKVSKALMAPGVQPSDRPAVADPRAAALAELRRRVEENSEYVGLEFAAEARKMHLGDTPERAIWGEAGIDEARALIEDGVPVAPLPFLPTRKSN